MATVTMRESGANRLARRQTPLFASLAVAVIIAAVVLPSALNVPQANPNTVAEYAPVPPSGEDVPPVGGNISGFGLGSSPGFGLPEISEGIQSLPSKKPTSKKCVGDPPRQSEDPMSPPCVAFFEGDNGGASYQGVTKDEIRVVIYTQLGVEASTFCDVDNNCDSGMPAGSYCDLDGPPNSDRACMPYNGSRDHWHVRGARTLAKHFNQRYQTYGRHVHVWLYAGPQNLAQAQTDFNAAVRADAADNHQRIRPFAVMPSIAFNTYADAMASRGVPSFGGAGAFQPNSFYRKYNSLVWAFSPDVEHWVNGYANYVCSRVVGRPVSFANNDTDPDLRLHNGQPRRFAYMHTTATSVPLNTFRDQVRPLLRQCGAKEVVEVTFPVSGPVTYAGGDGGSYGAANVAKLKQNGVSTILWFGGVETYTGQAADRARYYPEIVIAGDGFLDGILASSAQARDWWSNAWGYTTALYTGETREGQPSFQACKDGNPNASRSDCSGGAGIYYRTFFMLFKAIQAAGPKVSPQSIDIGLHALPAIKSTHPMLAACYFDPGDYTCVKDGAEVWWDPDQQSAFFTGPGCFHMTRGASRYLPGTWPPGADVFTDRGPCSPVLGGATIGAANPSAPQV